VRLLGELLGNVIADFGGASLLRDVEKLRGLAIRAREDGRFEREAEKLVASWPLDRAGYPGSRSGTGAASGVNRGDRRRAADQSGQEEA